MREKVHITGVCAALMACLAILWIRGDAGTAQQTKQGGLYEPWWGSATPGVMAMVEDTQLDIKVMRYQGWDPGDWEMYTIKEGLTVKVMHRIKEMYRSEGLHTVYKFKGMIWVYVITGIVTEWDNGQQCYERVMMGNLFKVDEVPGIRHMSMDHVGVWDTGQQAHMMPDLLKMRFQEWDPGEKDNYSKMYLHEGLHRVHMAKEVIRRYVITGIVMEWVIKQQCHERAMMGDLFKEDKAPGIRLLYGDNMVVWDTGQRTHRAQPAKVEQNMIDQSAFFGWCTDVRGTNAGVDAMELIEYESHKFLSQSSQCFRHQLQAEQRRHLLCGQRRGDQQGPHAAQRPQQQEESDGGHQRHSPLMQQVGRLLEEQHKDGQRPHHHQEGGHGGHYQLEAHHGHLHQQGGHSLLPRPAGHQLEQQAGRGHCQQRHPLLGLAGRPPEGGYGCDDEYDDISLRISFRNRFEQNPSVLDGGGASLVVRCRLHEERNKVYCRVTFRYLTWNEVQARTDTLVGQPPYLETRGWEEVVPFGD